MRSTYSSCPSPMTPSQAAGAASFEERRSNQSAAAAAFQHGILSFVESQGSRRTAGAGRVRELPIPSGEVHISANRLIILSRTPQHTCAGPKRHCADVDDEFIDRLDGVWSIEIEAHVCRDLLAELDDADDDDTGSAHNYDPHGDDFSFRFSRDCTTTVAPVYTLHLPRAAAAPHRFAPGRAFTTATLNQAQDYLTAVREFSALGSWILKFRPLRDEIFGTNRFVRKSIAAGRLVWDLGAARSTRLTPFTPIAPRSMPSASWLPVLATRIAGTLSLGLSRWGAAASDSDASSPPCFDPETPGFHPSAYSDTPAAPRRGNNVRYVRTPATGPRATADRAPTLPSPVPADAAAAAEGDDDDDGPATIAKVRAAPATGRAVGMTPALKGRVGTDATASTPAARRCAATSPSPRKPQTAARRRSRGDCVDLCTSRPAEPVHCDAAKRNVAAQHPDRPVLPRSDACCVCVEVPRLSGVHGALDAPLRRVLLVPPSAKRAAHEARSVAPSRQCLRVPSAISTCTAQPVAARCRRELRDFGLGTAQRTEELQRTLAPATVATHNVLMMEKGGGQAEIKADPSAPHSKRRLTHGAVGDEIAPKRCQPPPRPPLCIDACLSPPRRAVASTRCRSPSLPTSMGTGFPPAVHYFLPDGQVVCLPRPFRAATILAPTTSSTT